MKERRWAALLVSRVAAIQKCDRSPKIFHSCGARKATWPAVAAMQFQEAAHHTATAPLLAAQA